MPNDLVSRAAVLAVVEKLWNHDRESFSDVNYCDVEAHVLAIPSAIAALPAAKDERWEKEIRSLIDDYRTTLKHGTLNSDTGEDMLHHVAEDLERIRDRLSPPLQEANPHE